MRVPSLAVRCALASIVLGSAASAQWNPGAGQWGKNDVNDVRVMTWNVKDGLCSSNAKVEGQNNWCAIARTIAAFQPDVLILQECADNSGNGTGSGSDSTNVMTNVMHLLISGGNDPYQGGTVTSYVKKYAPSFSMPHIFVSSDGDGFNRNVIASRYPFSDLNGDTRETLSNIPFVSSDAYAPGGDGGLRGFMFAEIDMPDGVFAGDLVVGNAHLKAGGSNSDEDQRREAAQNVAYYIDYMFNGAGTGTPDPNGKISDSPQVQTILPADTPVIIGGDWNEDEVTNGQKGPAEWLTRAQQTGGNDGTDRDGSDMIWDSATWTFGNSDNTIGNSKLDYLAHQDSIVSSGVQTVWDSGSTPSGAMPPEVAGFPNPSAITNWASDHRPVIVDYDLVVDCPAPSNYCVGLPNSAGPGTSISYQGTTSIAANDFDLLSSNSPTNVFGLFFYGAATANVSLGDGVRCVAPGGVGLFRFNPASLTSVFGEAFLSVDNTAPPIPAGQINSGETWYFQYWYRDAAAGLTGFNLSDALEVTFCP
jgi:endonuclease/exonuclease/phosphatase family metal-dependent hydrolase